MKSHFGKFEKKVIKSWSQTIHYNFFLSTQHDFGLFDIKKKISSQFVDLYIENSLGRGTPGVPIEV
jgi:hypothetical protein